MRGGPVFLIFFILFTLASLAIPVPLFPGNVIFILLGFPSTSLSGLLSAVANGFTYGFIVWVVFILATRNLDESGSADFKSVRRRKHQDNRKRVIKR